MPDYSISVSPKIDGKYNVFLEVVKVDLEDSAIHSESIPISWDEARRLHYNLSSMLMGRFVQLEQKVKDYEAAMDAAARGYRPKEK
jgi:hypothetical protein